MDSPPPVPSPQQSADMECFDALLWALSRPGSTRELPLESAAARSMLAIGNCLLDLETSFYADDATLTHAFVSRGARSLPASQAEYLFLTHWNPSALSAIEQAKRGEPLYPDRSATIFAPVSGSQGIHTRWTGPGIESSIEVDISGIPGEFWTIRERQLDYPLGWDVVLVFAGGLLGLPRTTQVELLTG